MRQCPHRYQLEPLCPGSVPEAMRGWLQPCSCPSSCFWDGPLSRTAVTSTLGWIGPAPVGVRGRSPISAFVHVRKKDSLCLRHLTSSLQKSIVITILFFFLASLSAMQDHRSLTRDQPCAPTLGVQRLNYQTTRDISAATVPWGQLLKPSS